jgi:hypothetical protein
VRSLFRASPGRIERTGWVDHASAIAEGEFFRSLWDPSEELATSLLARAPYAGSPWRSENYGLVGQTLSSANPPTAGTPQNGWTPASFNGTTNFLTADGVADDYVGPTSVTIQAVVWVSSATAPSTYAFDDPCIVVAQYSGIFAVGVSTSGVRFGVYLSTGYVETTPVAMSTGAWHRVQARYDGANVSVRVDGGAWTDVAATDPFAASGSPLLVGVDIVGTTKFLPVYLLEIAISPSASSNPVCDAWDSYAVTRYGLSISGITVPGFGARLLSRYGFAAIVPGFVAPGAGRAPATHGGTAAVNTAVAAPGAGLRASLPRGSGATSPALALVGAGLRGSSPAGTAPMTLAAALPGAGLRPVARGGSSSSSSSVATAGSGLRSPSGLGSAAISSLATSPGFGRRILSAAGSGASTAIAQVLGAGLRASLRGPSSAVSLGAVAVPGLGFRPLTRSGTGLVAGSLTFVGFGLAATPRAGFGVTALGVVVQSVAGFGKPASFAAGSGALTLGAVAVPGVGRSALVRAGTGTPASPLAVPGAGLRVVLRAGGAPLAAAAPIPGFGRSTTTRAGSAGVATQNATVGAGLVASARAGTGLTLAGLLAVPGRGARAELRGGAGSSTPNYSVPGFGLSSATRRGAGVLELAALTLGAGAPVFASYGAGAAVLQGTTIPGFGLRAALAYGTGMVTVREADQPGTIALVDYPLCGLRMRDFPQAVLELEHDPVCRIAIRPEVPMHKYQVGDSAVFRGEFRLSETNLLADPLTITATITPPSGAPIDVSYPATTFERVSLGIYRLTIDCTEPGIWRVRWASTGDAKAAEQRSFVVDELG